MFLTVGWHSVCGKVVFCFVSKTATICVYNNNNNNNNNNKNNSNINNSNNNSNNNNNDCYYYLKNKVYKTIILPVVLYGCEAGSLTLREERRLRVFENRIPMANGEWRRLHNEELHSLYRSPNIVRVIKSRRLSRPCSQNGRREEGF